MRAYTSNLWPWLLAIPLGCLLVVLRIHTFTWHPTANDRIQTDFYALGFEITQQILSQNQPAIPITFIDDGLDIIDKPIISVYDQWNRKYRYAVIPKGDILFLCMVSSGPDTVINTTDDIWCRIVLTYDESSDQWQEITSKNGTGTSWASYE